MAEPSGIHAHVCHLRTDRRRLGLLPKRSTGSAVLVEGRYLITAAHNVADYSLSSLHRVRVSCGVPVAGENTVIHDLDRAEIKRVRAVPGYAYRILNPDPQFEYDFAFLEFMTDRPADVGFLVDSTVVPRVGERIYLGGYPGGSISSGDSLHTASGRIVGLDVNLMTYDIETATGNSGGPLWVVRDQRVYLVGIHVTDRTGRVLNQSFHQRWRRWMAERGGVAPTTGTN